MERCEWNRATEHVRGESAPRGVIVVVRKVTEMDCPIRFRAGVLTGVMTPVRLWEFATGLTLLLLGS